MQLLAGGNEKLMDLSGTRGSELHSDVVEQ